MAKEHSFDIVSQLDFQEVDNAVNQAIREVNVRYDLKDSNCKLNLDKKNREITITAPDEFKLRSVIDILQSKLIKRDISLKALKYQKITSGLGGTASLKIDLVDGLSQESTKAISKIIKSAKAKVKVKIENNSIRASSQSKDALQQIIRFIKEEDLDIPLQFVNYR